MKITTQTEKIYRNQKPIDCDTHFKYRCPNSSCSADHWRTGKEVSVKNFKIVCYCGSVIKPKQIKGIHIQYVEDNQNEKPISQTTSHIPQELLDKCIGVMVGYGFTKDESVELIKSAYIKNPTDNCVSLIKYTLENIGVNYVESNKAI